MVSVDVYWATKKVSPPFLQGSHYRQEFLLVYRVVLLCAVKLHRVECDWSCCLTEAEDCTCSPVAGIAGDEYFVVARVVMVYYGEAFSSHHNLLYRVECPLVVIVPWGEFFPCLFGSEWGQDPCMFCKVWQKGRNVSDQSQERSYVGCGFGHRPVEDLFHLVIVGFDPSR